MQIKYYHNSSNLLQPIKLTHTNFQSAFFIYDPTLKIDEKYTQMLQQSQTFMSSNNQKESNYKTTPGIFEVESILQRGRSDNQIFYLVKWKGYPEQEATWEPESNLSGCREAILEFERIIKRMEEEKTTLGSLTSKTKRKPKRDKPHQNLNSKPKETSNEESSNLDQFKKIETQPLADRPEEKNQIKISLQSAKIQLSKAAQSLETLSSNDDIQSTTAQTIQTKISQGSVKLLHQLPKGNSSDDSKKTLTTNQPNLYLKPSMKFENGDALSKTERYKEQVVERQRENAQDLRGIQRITKKNKKSEGNEMQKNQTQQKSQPQEGQSNQNQGKLNTNEKEQDEKINSNKLSLIQSKESQLKVRKTQNPIRIVSQREALCDQQFKQSTLEFLASLDTRLKRDLKIEQDQYSINHSHSKRFIDLTNPLFSSINSKLTKIILTKKQTEKLDNEGDLLYCQIEALIKICDCETKDQKCSWITAMKCYENDAKENQNCYFLKIDDLKSETWKKKFRKFLVPNL